MKTSSRWVQYPSTCAITGKAIYITQRMDEWLASADLPASLSESAIEAAMIAFGAVEANTPDILGAVNLRTYVIQWLDTKPYATVLKLCRKAKIDIQHLENIAAGRAKRPSPHVLTLLGLRAERRYYRMKP